MKSILNEGKMNDLKVLADEIIDDLADEGVYNVDRILTIAKGHLLQWPEYRNNPEKLKGALKVIADYVR